jgi:endoglucanase
MDDEDRKTLRELVEVRAPSGFEEAYQERWKNIVAPAADEVVEEGYGNIVAISNGDHDDGIVFSGRADQIGLIVRRIDDEGYVQLGKISAIDPTVLPGRRLTVYTKDGAIRGVVDQQAIHPRDDARAEPLPVEEQRIDLGVTDGDNIPVRVGDPITFDINMMELGGRSHSRTRSGQRRRVVDRRRGVSAGRR